MNEWMNEWMKKWINEWMNDKELIACFQRNFGQYLQYLRNARLVIHRQTDRRMDKQMERQTEGLTNWYTNRHTDQWTDWQSDPHKICHLSLSRKWENDNFFIFTQNCCSMPIHGKSWVRIFFFDLLSTQHRPRIDLEHCTEIPTSLFVNPEGRHPCK